ncbi:MAG: hypothetical protein EZS28_045861, partial [Streblomastix strix]
TGVQVNEIDFWATNILDEQNGEARRREIQCPSLLPVTSVPVPDEVLDAKRSPIDKILQNEQALALYIFRIGQGILTHLIAKAGSADHCQKRHSEQRRDRNYKLAIWNPIAGKGKGQDQEISSNNAISDLETGDVTNAELECESGLASKPGNLNQKNTRLYASSELGTTRLNSAKQEIPGIPNVLTKETIKDHMHKRMLKGFDLIPVGKDDEGLYWPRLGPGVPHATDRRKAKQQGQTLSMDDVRAFWKEHNFDLRVACVRRDYDSEDDSETLQPTKTTRREFRNKFGRNRNRSLSPLSKRSRYDSPDRGSESRERSGSRSYSRSRQHQSSRETADKGYNGFETRNEQRGRGRGTYRGRGYNYQGKGSNYQD